MADFKKVLIFMVFLAAFSAFQGIAAAGTTLLPPDSDWAAQEVSEEESAVVAEKASGIPGSSLKPIEQEKGDTSLSWLAENSSPLSRAASL